MPQDIVKHFTSAFSSKFTSEEIMRTIGRAVICYCAEDVKEHMGKKSTNDIMNSNKWNLKETEPSSAIFANIKELLS